MKRWLVLALAVIGVSCSSGLSNLEPAPLPESFEGGPWGVQFRVDLAPGFWEAGHHRYQLWLECEPLGPRQWSQHNFEADSETEIIDDDVYVRFRGLSLTQTGPTGIKHLNVDQPTIALVTVLGLEEDVARSAAGECVAELRLEDGTVFELPPLDPFRV